MKFRYTCVGCPKSRLPELFHIIDDARQITYNTFLRRVGYAEIKRWENELGYDQVPGLRLATDYGVSFHASRTLDGRRVYYFAWSSIEHVYY